MKIYTKQYEDVSCIHIRETDIEHVGVVNGSINDLIKMFRSFYYDTSRTLFDIIVKQTWLELQMTYKGKRRKRRVANCYQIDKTYSLFMMSAVGRSQKAITANYIYTIISSFLPELFPDFLKHNPFNEPEYYKYPFNHVTLDFFSFVQKHHERLEMLKYADEKEMTIRDFENWATNQAYCYNDEKNQDIYRIGTRINSWKYIRKMNETKKQKELTRTFK